MFNLLIQVDNFILFIICKQPQPTGPYRLNRDHVGIRKIQASFNLSISNVNSYFKLVSKVKFATRITSQKQEKKAEHVCKVSDKVITAN